jgi:hypothetical protein
MRRRSAASVQGRVVAVSGKVDRCVVSWGAGVAVEQSMQMITIENTLRHSGGWCWSFSPGRSVSIMLYLAQPGSGF